MLKAVITLFAGAAIALTVVGPTLAGHTASGGGTYFVATGILSQFQFSPGSLQCKVATAPPFAREFQMFMFSTSITDFRTDTHGFPPLVMVEGDMVSTTVFGRGKNREVLTEVVPFEAVGEDAGTPGAGFDFFSLTVEYADVMGGQGPQFAGLSFGSCDGSTCTITFEGTLESGNVRVH